jgi:curli biogenesis system outer membrane secretion channel CsgG
MCQLIHPDCSIKYVGQTGQSFISRFKEHLLWFKCGNSRCTFAQHRTYNGKAMNTTDQLTEIISTVYRTGGNMRIIDSFNIYMEKGGNQINDRSILNETRLVTGAT